MGKLGESGGKWGQVEASGVSSGNTNIDLVVGKGCGKGVFTHFNLLLERHVEVAGLQLMVVVVVVGVVVVVVVVVAGL